MTLKSTWAVAACFADRLDPMEAMTAVMLANHRRVAPFGVAGGAPGALGENWVERSDGSRESFGATFKVEMRPGDVFVVRTPGGGGYGPPGENDE